MLKQSTDHVYLLIKSLSKAEKKNFKVFANRQGSQGQRKFIQLFDAMDKASIYDEGSILKKVPGIKKGQISNLKANLYKQILISLRLIHITDNIDIQIREQIDFATMLYNKGLFPQSLKILEKAKAIAIKYNYHDLALEIIHIEKLIESRYITRSITGRAEELIAESEEMLACLNNHNELSSLTLRLYSFYIKTGHVANKESYEAVKKMFEANVARINVDSLKFYEKMHYYVAYGWYSYIIQDFKMYFKYSQKWVNLMDDNPEIKKQDSVWYLKALHNLLEALYISGAGIKFSKALDKLEEFIDSEKANWEENQLVLSFIYLNTSKINKHFLQGTFDEGIELIEGINKQLQEYATYTDHHRILVFYYKIACLYFGSGDFKNCILYLNKIINIKDVYLREDIHCFARILNLIAHFELGNQDLVDYQIRSVYRFLIKMNDLNEVQKEILSFLKNLPNVQNNQINDEFKKLRKKLLIIRKDPYEKRPFLYLDIISWLESKLDGIHVQDIIREKFKSKELRW